MFSRYVLHATTHDIATAFNVELNEISTFNPNYNAAPGDRLPIVLMGNARQIQLTTGMWTSVDENRHAFETRDLEKNETLRKQVLRKRCIIPISGYYEWKRLSGTLSIPFYLRLLNRPLLGIAGVYARKTDDSGEEYLQFTAFQTRSNELVEPLSEQMPAILEPDQWHTWIDPLVADVDRITSMIHSADTMNMASYRISNAVDNPNRNDAALLTPVL